MSAHDFDELVRGREGVTFTLAGQEWPLPVELPHQALLYLDVLQAEKGAEWRLGWTEIVALARHIWDDPTVDGWLQAGVGVQRLSALVEWAVVQLTPRRGEPSESP